MAMHGRKLDSKLHYLVNPAHDVMENSLHLYGIRVYSPRCNVCIQSIRGKTKLSRARARHDCRLKIRVMHTYMHPV